MQIARYGRWAKIKTKDSVSQPPSPPTFDIKALQASTLLRFIIIKAQANLRPSLKDLTWVLGSFSLSTTTLTLYSNLQILKHRMYSADY